VLGSSRVLLINPPLVDLRIPWANWIEPTGLLKIGAVLREQGTDVRLLDCFQSAPLRRQLDAVVHRDGHPLNRWRYGLRTIDMTRALRALSASGWPPDHVFITTLTSVWWRGAPLAAASVRNVFPRATVTLGGGYTAQAPAHAALHGGADHVGDVALEAAAASRVAAYDLYEGRISVATLTDLGALGVEGAMATVDAAVARGATRIHLADHGLAARDPALLTALLERLSGVYPRTRLHVLGSIGARDIAAWPELPGLLRAARCRQIVLSDNRDYPADAAGAEGFVEEARRATAHVAAAGFRVRSDDYAVEMSVGRPGETPDAAARLLARLVPVAGSVIPVPYEPTLREIDADDPWEINGKLFPLAARNGSTFGAYMELLGLCALTNAKHRTLTFDFAADSTVARSLRRALKERAWVPEHSGSPRPLRVVDTIGR
jgi:hypothetical protein